LLEFGGRGGSYPSAPGREVPNERALGGEERHDDRRAAMSRWAGRLPRDGVPFTRRAASSV